MKLTWKAFAFVNAVAISATEGSFLRDVASDGTNNIKQDALESALLKKAMPLEEYKLKMEAKGFHVPERHMEEDGQNDDYFMNANNMYSFSGYSLKYAKCQPVQRFSENAISAGEYTPMVTDDIAILRLCPYRFCTTSRTFGCHYNYAEYAIGLSDYIRIMLRYRMDKEEQLCDFCNECYRRVLEEAEEEGGDDQVAEDGDDYQAEAADDGDDGEEEEEDAADNDDGAAANDDANADDDYTSEDCSTYNSYCYDSSGNQLCAENGNDDDSYLEMEDYLNYLDCVNIKDAENYNYYVRPRCDGYDETIKMAIYYDSFCSQYAGNDVSLKDFGLGFNESYFVDIYEEAECIDCSESNTPPNFNSNSNMCNAIHVAGASCKTNLQYDMFDDGGESDSTQCSFIESVRFGTYDEDGRLFTEDSFFGTTRAVTHGQKIAVSISLLVCALLALYSCYLHHSITNLLIKSLSHTDLLPPSRHRRASRSNSRNRRSSSGRRRHHDDDDDDDEDWRGFA